MASIPRAQDPLPTRALRRGVLAWGLGHLAIGLRRGWLLLGGEVATLALLCVVLIPRAGGTLSDLVFCALVLFFVAWAAQAIDAYRRAAVMVVAEPTEPSATAAADHAPLLLLTLILPATVVLTAFWLFGGAAATPSATLHQYVVDWRNGDAAGACEHVVDGIDEATISAMWSSDAAYIEGRVRALAAELGSVSGFDPDRPFSSLGFTLDPPPADGAGGDVATASIDLVRQTTVHESFLGLFPAVSQRSVAVERVGTIRLRLAELPAPFGIGPPDRAWRVEGVTLASLP